MPNNDSTKLPSDLIMESIARYGAVSRAAQSVMGLVEDYALAGDEVTSRKLGRVRDALIEVLEHLDSKYPA